MNRLRSVVIFWVHAVSKAWGDSSPGTPFSLSMPGRSTGTEWNDRQQRARGDGGGREGESERPPPAPAPPPAIRGALNLGRNMTGVVVVAALRLGVIYFGLVGPSLFQSSETDKTRQTALALSVWPLLHTQPELELDTPIACRENWPHGRLVFQAETYCRLVACRLPPPPVSDSTVRRHSAHASMASWRWASKLQHADSRLHVCF